MQPFSNWGGHGLHDICSISGAREGSFWLGWGGSSHSQSNSSTLGWIAGMSGGQRVLRGYCSSCVQCLEQGLCCTHFCRASSARCLPGLTSHAGARTLTSLSDAMMPWRWGQSHNHVWGGGFPRLGAGKSSEVSLGHSKYWGTPWGYRRETSIWPEATWLVVLLICTCAGEKKNRPDADVPVLQSQTMSHKAVLHCLG